MPSPISTFPFLLLAAPVALAATITGTVTDGTVNKPSAGDAVVLISLQQRMQEAARTTTDAHGRYSLEVPDAGMHLIRVDHQKASYFQPAPPNTTTVDVQVYDVAPVVQGITTEAAVMRVETDPQGLKVTQSYFIKNDSHPPRTQFSNHSYEIYLPPDAQIEGAAAMGPGGMPVASSPAPMGEKGHYAYLFPLRPGETQFQVSYRMPYSGAYTFTPKLAAGGADNVVVMLPKSMAFKPAAGTPYQPVNDDINAQTFVAKSVTAAQPLAFAVSGSGALPRDVQAQGGQSNGQQAEGAAPGQPGAVNGAEDTRPGGGLGNPIDTPDPLNKYKWWILSGIGLALAIAAAFFLRRPAPTTAVGAAAYGPTVPPSPFGVAEHPVGPHGLTAPGAAPSIGTGSTGQLVGSGQPSATSNGHTPLLAALKDELFALETDRLQGNVTEADYTAHKAALETVLRRALNRS